MKKFFSIIVCILIFNVNIVQSNERKLEVILPTDIKPSWRPYHYIDENGEETGTDFNLLKSTLNQLNIELSFVKSIPLKRLVYQNDKLGFNSGIAVTYSEERAESYYFSIPYRKERVYVYYSNPVFDEFNSVDDFLLASYRVRGVLNLAAYYGEAFEQLKQKHSSQLMHIESASKRLQKLQSGEVDFILGDDLNHAYLLSQLENHTIRRSSFTLIEQDVSFVFSKAYFDEAFIDKFNQALSISLKKQLL